MLITPNTFINFLRGSMSALCPTPFSKLPGLPGEVKDQTRVLGVPFCPLSLLSIHFQVAFRSRLMEENSVFFWLLILEFDLTKIRIRSTGPQSAVPASQQRFENGPSQRCGGPSPPHPLSLPRSHSPPKVQLALPPACPPLALVRPLLP